MSMHGDPKELGLDSAPGEQETGPHSIATGIRSYVIGLVLAAGLTFTSFWVASGPDIIYRPGIPMALAGAGRRPNGRSPRFFPAHHDGAGQHQQRIGVGVRRTDRWYRHRRLVVDHVPLEHKHDGSSRHDGHAQAAVKQGLKARPSVIGTHAETCQAESTPQILPSLVDDQTRVGVKALLDLDFDLRVLAQA